MTVTLIGAGSWGCALARLLLLKGHALRWWVHKADLAEALSTTGHHPTVFPEYAFQPLSWVGTDLDEALRGSEAVILALPSRYMEEVLQKVQKAEIPWLSSTKGLLPGRLLRPSQYLATIGISQIAILSGPSHAEEVIQGKPTWVAVGTKEPFMVSLAESLLAQPTFHLLPTPYKDSLEWVGVLKNIYAILMGVVGLWGDNARAALAAVTLGELKEVLHTLVPDEPCPFLSPAWTGDFLVTAFSGHSRNQRFGQLLAQGYSAPIALQKLGMVAEGYYAAQAIVHWPSYRDFPLLSLAIEALTGRSDPFALRETLLRVLSEKGTGEIA